MYEEWTDVEWYRDDSGAIKWRDMGTRRVHTHAPAFYLLAVFPLLVAVVMVVWFLVAFFVLFKIAIMPMILTILSVAFGILMWRYAFYQVLDKYLVIRQIGSKMGFFTRSMPLYIPGYMRLVRMRWTSQTVRLDGSDLDRVKVVVRHSDNNADATEEEFDVTIQYRLMIPESLSVVMGKYFDDFADQPTLTQAGLVAAERQSILPQFSLIVKAAFDAALQALYSNDIYMKQIRSNLAVLTPMLIAKLRGLLRPEGILVEDIQVGRVSGPYMNAYLRKSVARPEAEADIEQARQRQLSGVAEADSRREILVAEQRTEQQRVETAKESAQADIQMRQCEIDLYQDDTNRKSELARSAATHPEMNKTWIAQLLTDAVQKAIEAFTTKKP